MRVAMLNLTRGGLSGGYRSYLRNLVPRLIEHSSISDLLMVNPPGHVDQASEMESATWEPHEHLIGYPSVRALVRDWKPDVVFIPTARWMDCGAPCVSMVRNMEPMTERSLDAGLGVWIQLRIAAAVARRAARKADRVIAVSAFVRDFLLENWGIEGRRIGVVPHGVTVTADEDTPPSLRAIEGVPFLLAAGSLRSYRGLEDGVQALARLKTLSRPVSFVIAGEGSGAYQTRIRDLAVRLDVADQIHWVGQLNERQMAWAFQRCAAFLMSSRVEACPNTVLEAMAHGAMSVSTTCRPMPEFFCETALYYQAGDGTGLAERINVILHMPGSERQSAQERAKLRAATFSWNTTARKTVEELETASAH